MKKNSKTNKKLASAFAMLMLSAAMLGTATYAWFTMNKEVTVDGMQVQARAEAGILVSNAADGEYDDHATTAKTTVAQLYPGSTSDLTNWFHSSSSKSDTANTQRAYDEGTAWTANTSAATRGNYVVHDFYLKSSKKGSDLSFDKLVIKELHVKVGDAAPSQELSKALRVGVKIAGDSNAYIFSPNGDDSYSVTTAIGDYDASNMTTVTAITTDTSDTTIASLPDIDTTTPTHVEVFIWFEGEDSECISDNIQATLEEISVDMAFEADGLVQD